MNMNKIMGTIHTLRNDLGIETISYCSREECKEFAKLRKEKRPLPDDVIYDSSNAMGYYRYITEMTQEEHSEYLSLLQLSYLQSIKNGVQWFVVLTVLGLIGGVIAAILLSAGR
jgi:hypothetical protein